MRSILLAITIVLLPASTALAQSGNPQTDPSATPSKLLPLKEPRAASSCAAYGPDFVRVEGTGMCVQMDVGVGRSIGAR